MPTEPELLRAVLDAPDDDGPRLAYADFAAAAGDPRGEFIRLQVALADQGGAPNDGADNLLRGRVRELLAAHRGEWSRPVAAYVEDSAFHRGFVEWVRLGARAFLRDAPKLFARAPVRHLDLTGAGRVLLDLVASPHLRRVRSLALERADVDDDAMVALAACPNLGELRWLSLAHDHVGFEGASALAGSPYFPELRYVLFSGNPIDPHERYAFDGGLTVDAWMPSDGIALEARHGHIRWLHGSPATSDDVVPDRFRR